MAGCRGASQYPTANTQIQFPSVRKGANDRPFSPLFAFLAHFFLGYSLLDIGYSTPLQFEINSRPVGARHQHLNVINKLSTFRVRLHQRGEGFVTFPRHGAQLRILCHQLLESPELQADGDAGADPESIGDSPLG